jgi:hypothetical protein
MSPSAVNGEVFFWFFGVAFVLTLGLVLLVRQMIWHRFRAPTRLAPEDLHPCDLALLAEPWQRRSCTPIRSSAWSWGALVGLMSLQRRRLIEVDNPLYPRLAGRMFYTDDAGNADWWKSQAADATSVTVVRACQPLPAEAHLIERGLYDLVSGNGAPAGDIVGRLAQPHEIRVCRDVLRDRRLLVDRRTAKGLRLTALLWLPLLGFGGVRLAYELRRDLGVLNDDQPSAGFLLLLVAAGVAFIWSIRHPKSASSAKRLVKALKEDTNFSREARLRLSQAPTGTAGRELQALAVEGPLLLWQAQPALAASLAVQLPDPPSVWHRFMEFMSEGCSCG